MTGLLANGVRLALVLCHSLVNLLNNVGTDRGREDIGDRVGGTAGLAIGADDRNGRSGSHCEDFCCLVREGIRSN